jgi:adenylate cyclase
VSALLHADRMPAEARGRILERAEGNPFFVEEIVGMLIDRGALERRNDAWTATGLLADVPTMEGASEARARAAAVLEPLGCVNPV